MFYSVRLTKEGKRWLADFPDCPGCQTYGETREEALEMAADALLGWLEAHFANGRVPPKPKKRPGLQVTVSPRMAVALQIRWGRARLNLTQGELAKRAGVSQQQIAKLEKLEGNPTVRTLEEVARALGADLSVSIRPEART